MKSGEEALSHPPSERPEDVAASRAPDPLDALARRAAEGDREAAQALLTAVAPRVLAIVRNILGPRHPDVDDALQETLIGLARSLPSWRGEGSILGYTSRIAVRSALHAARKARARDGRRGEEHAHAGPPEDGLTQRRRDIVRAMLEALPAEQAETLALRVCHGASLHEVAEVTGVPVNTVRSRVRLAKEALKRRFARFMEGDE